MYFLHKSGRLFTPFKSQKGARKPGRSNEEGRGGGGTEGMKEGQKEWRGGGGEGGWEEKEGQNERRSRKWSKRTERRGERMKKEEKKEWCRLEHALCKFELYVTLCSRF